ncbi:MAG: helix-turn-helix domain-containing protein [Myxococcota bacterium]
MARPPAFDRGNVINRAMQVFWQHGYQATSMRALSEATGLKPGSLYAAFGSKEGLFFEVLTAYGAQVKARAARERPTTLIKAWFQAHIERSIPATPGSPGRGCLLLGSAAEIEALGPECRALVRAELDLLERTFATCLGPKHPTPAKTARLLVAALMGISTMARAGAERAVLNDVAQAALAATKVH